MTMTEKTFSILKPDAVEGNFIGKIIGRFEEEGLKIAALEMRHLARHEAEGFYAEHKARPFFGELCDFMTRSPVVLMVLEGKDAIAKNRKIMGATNPANADAGTIRKMFSKSVGENSVHGSDSPEAAAREIAYFFRGISVYGKKA